MKLQLRHKLPAVVGAAVLMTAASGAAAFALVAAQSNDGTAVGNSLPIDDNHASVAPSAGARTPEPGDDRGAASVVPAGNGAATTEPGDDRGAAAAEPGDDHRGDHLGAARTGSDDATTEASKTPEPAETQEPAEHSRDDGAPTGSGTATATATATEDHGGSDGTSSSSGGGTEDSGSGSSDSSGSGGHGSDG